jgi:hypothetical protein
MPTQITSSGITFNDTTSLTSANGVPSALKLTTARTINGVSFDGTGNITIPATSISGANVAKAWVNFNGTTPSSAGRSFNVSSVTKNGTGDYTINFATAMADANYSVSATSQPIQDSFENLGFISVKTFNTGSVRIKSSYSYHAYDVQDVAAVCAQIFGN